MAPMTSAPPLGLLVSTRPPVMVPVSSTVPVEPSRESTEDALLSAPEMMSRPLATLSRTSELKLAVLKLPARLRVPASRSSEPEEDQVVALSEVTVMLPPAALMLPALFQLRPPKVNVLLAVDAMAVPEKVPPEPK